jgi:tol-pal system protein YbgF
MSRWASVTPVLLLVASGCLASKSDIRLLQEELQVNRAQLARSDSAAARADAARRAQVQAVSEAVGRASDSLRALSARTSLFQTNTRSQFEEVVRELTTAQALLGQTTKNLDAQRAAFEALQEKAIAPPPDTTAAASPTAGIPGPATLYGAALAQLRRGSCATARGEFAQFLTSYPNDDDAPAAQLQVAETFACEGNAQAADSVYQVVVKKYPTSRQVPTALYKRARALRDSGDSATARPLLQRIVRDYPSSDEARLANDLLKSGH